MKSLAIFVALARDALDSKKSASSRATAALCVKLRGNFSASVHGMEGAERAEQLREAVKLYHDCVAPEDNRAIALKLCDEIEAMPDHVPPVSDAPRLYWRDMN